MNVERYLMDQSGNPICAYCALREQGAADGSLGPSREYQSLIFETVDHQWLGSVVISRHGPIDDFSDDELRALLRLVRHQPWR